MNRDMGALVRAVVKDMQEAMLARHSVRQFKEDPIEEREDIIRMSLDCGGGCENCSSCWLGGGSPWDMYQDYIDGKKEIAEINMEYNARYLHG